MSTARKFKRYLALFWSNYQCVRKFIGGRWAQSKVCGEWVQFNDPGDEVSWDCLTAENYVREDYNLLRD